jgi:ribonuclease G
VIRDLLTRNVDKVRGRLRAPVPPHPRLGAHHPAEFADRIQLHTGSQPLFEQYGVEAAIRSTLNRRVDLPSGGYLLFDYAEAFTVIDVNSGRPTGQSHLEETTLRTNVEAAREVMRQLRLRDIGGIIVIDFIDLERERNRKELLAVLQEELAKDRTKTYLVDISPLGLVEMTRQNTTEGVRETLTSICPTCGGEGACVAGHDGGRGRAQAAQAGPLVVVAGRSGSGLNAKVAAKLAGPGGTRLIELERRPGASSRSTARCGSAGGAGADRRGHPRPGRRRRAAGEGGRRAVAKIAEPHMFNLSDGSPASTATRCTVGGAIGYVGEEHRRAHRPARPQRRLRNLAGRQDRRRSSCRPSRASSSCPTSTARSASGWSWRSARAGRAAARCTTTTTPREGAPRSEPPTGGRARRRGRRGRRRTRPSAEAKPKRRRSRGGRSRATDGGRRGRDRPRRETRGARAAAGRRPRGGEPRPTARPAEAPRGTRGGRAARASAAAADAPHAALLEPPTGAAARRER